MKTPALVATSGTSFHYAKVTSPDYPVTPNNSRPAFIPKRGAFVLSLSKEREREYSSCAGTNVCLGQQKCLQGVRFRKEYLSHICIKSLAFLQI